MPGESTISKVLIPLLESHKTIDIPGLGSFSLVVLPASLEADTHLLYPPLQTLVFEDILKGGYSLFDVLPDNLSKKGISKLKAEIDFAINEFVNLGKTNIEGLAFIEKGDDGIAKVAHLHANVQGYRDHYTPIQLTPIREVTPSPKPVNPSNKSTPVAHTKARTIGSPQRTEPNWQTYMLPLFLVILGMLIIGWLVHKFSNNPAPISPADTQENLIEKDDLSPYTQDTAYQIFKNDNIARYSHVLTDQILLDGCTIVVGSFTNRDGALSLMEEVRAYDYQVDELSVVAPFRVIIRFDCREHDLDNYLIQVRELFDDKAWYLSPDYDIE